MSLVALGLVWRMVDLTILNQAFLKRQGDARTLRVLSMPATRGIISDRNGSPLAVSTPVESIWINPNDFSPSTKQLKRLATYLETNPASIQSYLTQPNEREFVYLKRGLDPAVAEKIKALKIPGLFFQTEFRRFYPEAEVTSHLLGLTNIDDHGQEGIELLYERWLSGVEGKKRVLKDRLGHVVADVDLIQQPQAGHDLVLSIDRRIQYLAYQALSEAVQDFQAASGSVVVLDAKTGEVLAMVNQPTFNPNHRPAIPDSSYRNRAVTDLLEPGSVMKSFSIASALASGKYEPETLIETSPGWIMVNGNRVQDDHLPPSGKGLMSLTEVLKRSSNVGTTKVVLSLPAENLLNLLTRVGFGNPTGSYFPGERNGSITPLAKTRSFVLATVAFGYGIAVTPLQLARAYSVFATHGRLVPISFLRVNQAVESQVVLKPTVADKMLSMLEAVVDDGGTAEPARIEGYRVAGKTGTARLTGAHGYMKNRHVASFVGIAPVSNPRLIVAVVVNDPRSGKYYSTQVGAPLFAKVMEGALRIMNVPPDKVT